MVTCLPAVYNDLSNPAANKLFVAVNRSWFIEIFAFDITENGLDKGVLAAGFVGSSSALAASSSFVSGATIGGGAGFSSGFVTGTGNGLIQGQNIGDVLWSGTKAGLIGGASGALLGGVAGGYDAYRNDRNFWTGKLPKGGDERIWGEIYWTRPRTWAAY